MKIGYSLAGLLFVLGLASSLHAQVLGKVDRIEGSASLRVDSGPVQSLVAGQEVSVGNTVQTSAGGEVHILTQDGGYLALRPNTQVVLQRYHAMADSHAAMELKLLQGALRSITGWIGKLYPSGYRINTPTATIGIRGTDHEVSVLEHADGDDPPGTYDSVHEGITILGNRDGKVLELAAGDNGYVGAEADVAPRLLARRPGFLLRRQLRIEERIEERREAMVERLQAFAQQHPERAEKLREQWEKLSPQQKEKRRDAIRSQIQRRRQGQP